MPDLQNKRHRDMTLVELQTAYYRHAAEISEAQEKQCRICEEVLARVERLEKTHS